MTRDEREQDPAGGVAIGSLSAIKNKKLMTIIGGVLMAIGIAGMIIVGSKAANIAQNQGFSFPDLGASFQAQEYAFMFVLIAGLVIVIYSQVTLQRSRAKERETRRRDTANKDTNAA